jgi:DNA invertase Pin-like site-specific DNA recombinase
MQRKAIEYQRPVDGQSVTSVKATNASVKATAPTEATNASAQATAPTGTTTAFTILDTVNDEGGPGREALAGALELLAAGDAEVLLTARLRSVAGSLREVVGLIDWLAAADADLVALDVDLDTGSDSGRALVAVLREIEGWDRSPESGRSPRGRPGLLGRRPDLAERIVALREDGLSLQRIADMLNADRVPTPRGGARWRPSSVQAALGYRRPSPPVPGAPPPGRGPKPPPGRGPKPPPGRGPKAPPRRGPDS